jgi:hypothetical protein
MTTSFEKFRKLLAAYEDEVQRKQHKMGKRVDPRDEAQPNWTTGYLTFLRGQTVVWSPSFELIGTYTPSSGAWLWGWADLSIEAKLKTRVDVVRSQGSQWGIDVMTSEALTIENEQQAWELATITTALARADGMYRIVDGDQQRFVALFDGPPASRSSTSMRAIRESQIGMQAVSIPPNPLPALGRQNTPMPRSGWQTGPSSSMSSPPASTSSPLPNEPEPTAATRQQIAQRLYEALPYVHQQQVGVVTMLARATPPNGPVGTVSLDVRITLKPNTGSAEIAVPTTGSLNDALVALWMRCRDKTGTPYRFATAKLEQTPQGLVPQVSLEW